VYLPGPETTAQQSLFLIDRNGTAEALKLPPGTDAYPRVSPDGTRLALQTSEANETFISIYDMSGASSVRRLTFGGRNRFPIWSSDSRRVAFQSDRDGDLAIFWQPADGGSAERLTKAESGVSHVPESWSPTGDFFLFSTAKGIEMSLWTYSMRDRNIAPFDDVRSMVFPTDAVFSPDARWVAYQVGERAVGEGVPYVQPFPPNGAKYEIARRGGRPVWSRDGKELFFIPAPGQFAVVTVKTQPTFTFSSPMAVHRGFGISDPADQRTVDTTPDGRIIGLGPSNLGSGGSPALGEIQVVLNWFQEVKARVPTTK